MSQKLKITGFEAVGHVRSPMKIKRVYFKKCPPFSYLKRSSGDMREENMLNISVLFATSKNSSKHG